jgi:hypothetical protein
VSPRTRDGAGSPILTLVCGGVTPVLHCATIMGSDRFLLNIE